MSKFYTKIFWNFFSLKKIQKIVNKLFLLIFKYFLFPLSLAQVYRKNYLLFKNETLALSDSDTFRAVFMSKRSFSKFLLPFSSIAFCWTLLGILFLLDFNLSFCLQQNFWICMF